MSGAVRGHVHLGNTKAKTVSVSSCDAVEKYVFS